MECIICGKGPHTDESGHSFLPAEDPPGSPFAGSMFKSLDEEVLWLRQANEELFLIKQKTVVANRELKDKLAEAQKINELREHQAEAWCRIAALCLVLGAARSPGKVATDQVENFIKDLAARAKHSTFPSSSHEMT